MMMMRIKVERKGEEDGEEDERKIEKMVGAYKTNEDIEGTE